MTLVELQARLLYSMIVAGKSAEFANLAIRKFLRICPMNLTPFQWIRELTDEELLERLKKAKTGNYNKLAKGYRELVDAHLDLQRCTPEELERIHGIGPKTSRFFILWTRPGAKYAALDVHILRWLKTQGYDAPKATPATPKRYAHLEQAFIKEAEARGMTPRELDARIWELGSQARNTTGVDDEAAV